MKDLGQKLLNEFGINIILLIYYFINIFYFINILICVQTVGPSAEVDGPNGDGDERLFQGQIRFPSRQEEQ